MSDIIPNVVVSMPSQLFTLARKFQAASNGKIFIGKIDTDPTIPENQIQVYLENEDGTTVPVSQPLIINQAGYPVYNGQIAKFVTVQGHSMAVYDSYGAQQFYYPNVLKYDPDQLRSELESSFADGSFFHMAKYKHGFSDNSTLRTSQSKLDDILSVKDFGAIGDGELHQLSERYTTLAEAKSVYPFVTDLSQSIDYAGIQAAINAAKNGNMAVYIPAGGYVVNSTIVADYAPSIHGSGGQGLRDTSSSHAPSQVRGSVIHSRVKSGAALKISPEKYCFGLTLRDFAIWGIDGECDVGLQLDHIGWMGIVEGVNIQYFPNEALKLGYIQDTYFTNCSFLASGNKQNPAVTCLVESNYVYFSGCHFELTPYMIKFDKCWFFSFDKCHFEVARPSGDGVTDDDRYFYASSCVDFGSSSKFQFSNNVWIPVDVGYLSKRGGVDRDKVPYFMSGSGTYFSFVNDIWMAPEGSINIGWFEIDHINFIGCQFIGLSPSKESIHISKRGKISECTFGINISQDESALYGCYIDRGSFTNNVIGFTSTGETKRNKGALLYGGCFASGNEYPTDNTINIYVDSTISVSCFDGKEPKYVDISSSGDIDLTKHHPGSSIRVTANDVTIGHIWGAQLGRDVIITTNGNNTIIEYKTNNVLTQGSVNYSLGLYRSVVFKCVNAGVNVLQQVS